MLRTMLRTLTCFIMTKLRTLVGVNVDWIGVNLFGVAPVMDRDFLRALYLLTSDVFHFDQVLPPALDGALRAPQFDSGVRVLVFRYNARFPVCIINEVQKQPYPLADSFLMLRFKDIAMHLDPCGLL